MMGGPFSGKPVYLGGAGFVTFPATAATDASVRAAARAALNAGGGTVLLPPGTITTNAPLPLWPGVYYYRGAPLGMTMAGNVPDNTLDVGQGTWFEGDGTFPCFQQQDAAGNPLDVAKGSPDANFTASGVQGCGVIGVGIKNYTRAISTGATNQLGVVYSRFEDIVAINCTDWAFYFANPMHCWWERLWSLSNADGYYFSADVAVAVLQPGNSTAVRLFDQVIGLAAGAARKHRGFMVHAPTGANLNQMTFLGLQCNNGGARTKTTYTAAAGGTSEFTLASGKGAELRPGMVVVFTNNGGNGNVAVGQNYFLRTVSGDTVSVANTMGGSAITGSFSASTSFWTYGHATLAVAGEGTGTVTNAWFGNLDLENVAHAALVVQRAQGCHFSVQELFANPGGEQHVVMRDGQPNVYWMGQQTYTTDIDGASVQNTLLGGAWNSTDSRQHSAMRFGRNATTGEAAITMVSADITARGSDLRWRQPSGGQFMQPGCNLGHRVYGNNGAGNGTSLNSNTAGHMSCTASGTGSITWNLPTIDASIVGNWWDISNERAGGGTPTLVLAATGGQTVKASGAGGTQVSLPGPSGNVVNSVRLLAVDNGSGGGFYWKVLDLRGGTVS